MVKSNVVRIGGKMPTSRKPKSIQITAAPIPDNVEVLPMPDTENLTPQQVLALLAKNKYLSKVIVIFPEQDFDDDNLEHTVVHSANCTIAEVSYFLDRAKFQLMSNS